MGMDGDRGQAGGHRATGRSHAREESDARDEAQEHSRGQAPRGFGTAGREPFAAGDHRRPAGPGGAVVPGGPAADSASEETRLLRASDTGRPPLTLTMGDRTWPLSPTSPSASASPTTSATPTLLIGRLADADVRVDHPEVSRRHALVEIGADGHTMLTDLGSVNGTYIGGRRVTTVRLTPGTAIHLGPGTASPVLTVRTATDEPSGPGPDRDPGHVVPHTPDGTVTIGRSGDNTLTIDDLQASRHHARATREGDGFWVEDLGSLNGTYVNGHPVTAAYLGPHDLLTIGQRHFRVEGGTLVMTRQRREVSLTAHGLRVVLPDGKTLLDGVDLALPTSSLMAVIGPSGAGKSTLLGALTGSRRASAGTVTFDGRDLYENYDELRRRIGLVPQDDVVHPQLTVRQALEYASRLRFPADLEPAARRARIDEVVAELELTGHADTRIDRLSGGQRKRTSVALELLTEPSLLFLDEPTSGLDPGLDKSVMTTLRTLADGGRTVIVVTHSVANLGMCDRVLLLAPGGKVAYFGPPEAVLSYFACTDYSDVFTLVAAHPDEVARRFARHAAREDPNRDLAPRRRAPEPDPPRRQQPLLRQVGTLAARHLRVLAADRSYTAFLAVLPIVLALLVLAVPGSAGFGPPGADRPTEKLQLLVVLIVGAAFMGMASSARDLVAERPIYRRERGVGLSPLAYLSAKVLVYLGMALLQSAVLVAVVLAVTDPPSAGLVLGSGSAELFVAVAATTFASAALGLLISACVSTSEQVMPLLVVAIMAQLVLCGGLIPVAGQAVLEQLSWVTPSRWGYAGAAATVDALSVPRVAYDELWEHTASAWWTAVGVLGGLTVAVLAATWARLRRVGA